MLAEHRLGEVVVDELRRRVFVHRHLFQDHLALGVQVGEGGPRDHLGKHGERPLEMLV